VQILPIFSYSWVFGTTENKNQLKTSWVVNQKQVPRNSINFFQSFSIKHTILQAKSPGLSFNLYSPMYGFSISLLLERSLKIMLDEIKSVDT